MKFKLVCSYFSAASLSAVAVVCAAAANLRPGPAPHAGNPILPGYFSDPSLVQHDRTSYLYATIDSWGGATLGCWESVDFLNWNHRELNWSTKHAGRKVLYGCLRGQQSG